MKSTPIICGCKSCECAIYTYEDSGVCKACTDDNHLSGAQKKDYTQNSQESPSTSNL